MNMKIDENAGSISGPFGNLCSCARVKNPNMVGESLLLGEFGLSIHIAGEHIIKGSFVEETPSYRLSHSH